jgi:hypothetical protein
MAATGSPSPWHLRLILELILDWHRHPDLTALVLEKIPQPRLAAIALR